MPQEEGLTDEQLDTLFKFLHEKRLKREELKKKEKKE